MRIVAGAWRGRTLAGPAGATRPTADRVRQALFDMLLHAPWGGRAAVDGVRALDVFAGTGALGLEALSRGAAWVGFIEHDRAALRVLRANLAACGAGDRGAVLAADALRPPPRASHGVPCGLVLLDPPYNQGLVPRALAALARAGWIAPGTLAAAELGRDEAVPDLGPDWGAPLAERAHGAARLAVWRATDAQHQAA